MAHGWEIPPVARRLAYGKLLDEEELRVRAQSGLADAERREEAEAITAERARLTRETAHVFAEELASTLRDLDAHHADVEKLRADIAAVHERPCPTKRSPP